MRGEEENQLLLSGQRSIPKVQPPSSHRRSKSTLAHNERTPANKPVKTQKEENRKKEVPSSFLNGPILTVKSDILVELEALRKQRDIKQA